MPLFSVVIPTYNRGRYLPQAVDSVLGQELQDFELIVVDDGSTDDTTERLAPYGDRVRCLRQDNRGVAGAKNLGISVAHGEWVGFLDSDDRWEPETLREVARVIGKHPGAGLIAFAAREVDAEGRRTDIIYGKRSDGPTYSTASLLGPDSGGCSWFCVRREMLDRVGGFDDTLRSAEECDLALRLSFETELRALSRPLLLRRRHAGNLSHDMALNARCWIVLLEKLRRARPEFVAAESGAYRRALAKARLRLGRELLATGADDPAALAESRSELRRSVAICPIRRAVVYLAWAWLAPTTYMRWREYELAARERRKLKHLGA